MYNRKKQGGGLMYFILGLIAGIIKGIFFGGRK